MDIRKIIREELKKSCTFVFMNEHTTKDSNYEFEPDSVWGRIQDLRDKGKSLDSDVSGNLSGLQVLSTGNRAGRDLAEIGYPDGTVVLFYKSKSGTSGKEQGTWYPIPGFTNRPTMRMPQGWFMKDSDIKKMYGSQVFQGTRDYLLANDGKQAVEEIDLSIGSSQRVKPGISREFPKEKEAGVTLSQRLDRGPNEFPQEEDL